jgi:hypothetical protein
MRRRPVEGQARELFGEVGAHVDSLPVRHAVDRWTGRGAEVGGGPDRG